MAGNINVPKDVAKIFEVKDKSDALYRFLVNLTNELNAANAKIADQEARIVILENAASVA